MDKISLSMLNLNIITLKLEGLEETIIYHLIERVQFKKNLIVYKPGKSGFQGYSSKSLLDIRLLFQEQMDAQFGRYCVPEERPFNKKLPALRRKVNLPQYPLALKNFNEINLTSKIKKRYHKLMQDICQAGDDGQYGSSVENDIYALQAISRRIHYGAMFVAESKFRSNTEFYRSLINGADYQALKKALTRQKVEEEIISRVKDKVTYAQAKVNPKIRVLIDPEKIITYYRNTIIPLTKEGEIIYLMKRQQV